MSNLEAVEPGQLFQVRELNAGDTRKVGAMIAKVTGDPRIHNAVASGEQNLMIMAIVACILDLVPRDVALLCASLIGITEKYDIKEYRKRERAEAREEQPPRLPIPEGELRFAMQEDIINDMDSYPAEAYLDIISEIMEKESFDRFLASSARLGTAARKGFARFQTPSKNGSDGPTET